MNEFTSILQQAQQLYVQHAPSEFLTQAVPAGIVLLIAGIVLSVLGAKFARFGLTAAAVVVGGAAGMAFAKGNGFAPLLGVLCGAFFIGMIGYQTYRLWVGVGTGLVVTLIAMGVFGQKSILPHVQTFEQMPVQTTAGGATEFTLPPAATQQAQFERTPQDWARDFWAYLTERQADTARNARGILAVALLTGLCIGLWATRWALIISTSVVGTALVAIGAATLLARSVPESCAAFEKNPGLAAAGLAGFLITSLILQGLLSRPVKTESE